MNNVKEICILLLACLLLYSGSTAHSVEYDYFATTKCLEEPLVAQYAGGVIKNADFNRSTDGWTASGKGIIEVRTSKGGNGFIVTRNRTDPLDSVSQTVLLDGGKTQSFSAWIQVSEGEEAVTVIFRTTSGELIRGGSVIAEKGCWSMLKGGVVPNFSGRVEILFECKNTTVDVWADSISLQPFRKRYWRTHQERSTERVRKKMVNFQVITANKTAVKSASVWINQTRGVLPFGCGINHHILESVDYQEWFTSRFTVTTFTNEMKWYSTEIKQGQENYTVADAMVKFAKDYNISIRGHNIFWDDPKYQPEWVKSLSSEQLQEAAEKRINSIVPRYKGQLIAWDVVNENLHFSFYEDKLGKNASAAFFAKAYQLDPGTVMFLNEYNTTESAEDEKPNPYNYVRKLQEILSFPGSAGIKAGIGVQGRFASDELNLGYMRSSLDILASTGLPIWFTEVSVDEGPNQANILEEVLKEAFSYPAVEGIVSFSGPEAAGFKVMPLTYENFTNTPNGDVVDKLLGEWNSGSQEIVSLAGGSFNVSLFHGDYIVSVEQPETKSPTTLTVNLKVTKDTPKDTVYIQLND